MHTKCLNKIKLKIYSLEAIKNKAMEYHTMLQFSGHPSKKKKKKIMNLHMHSLPRSKIQWNLTRGSSPILHQKTVLADCIPFYLMPKKAQVQV